MQEDILQLDEVQLSYWRFLPEDQAPRAVVHIVHGLAEHAARYRRLAEALAAEGWAVYTHDQRGHGRSAPDESALGFFAEDDGWARVVADLRSFVEMEKKNHPEIPLAMFGHSMGSLLVQEYLSRYEASNLDAAVMSGTSGPPPPIATVGRLVARVERARQGPRGRSALLEKLVFGGYNRRFKPVRTPFDWLSRDNAEVDAYCADPKCGFRATNQLWVDLMDALPSLSKKTRIERIPKSLPIYLVSGDRDPLGANGRGVQALADRYRASGLKDVTVALYPEARHEVLNESNRTEITANLVSWLRTKLN